MVVTYADYMTKRIAGHTHKHTHTHTCTHMHVYTCTHMHTELLVDMPIPCRCKCL